MRQNLVSRFIIFAVLSMSGAAGAQSAPLPPPMPNGSSSRSVVAPPPMAPLPPAVPVAYGVEGTPPRSVALRLTLSPEWAYRTFIQHEPASPDKRYVGSGIPSQSVRLELYPLAFGTPLEVAKDFGVTFNYGRSIPGMVTHDIDTDTDIGTQWYRFGFGARYRFLGGTRPIAMGITLGVERSVYDFDAPTPAARPVAIGRYTLVPVGTDLRYAWGRFSIFADARILWPMTASPFGNRTPTDLKLGGHLGGGGILRFGRYFEVEARVDYTLLYLQVPAAGGRSEKGSVFDQYLVFSIGPTLLLY